jgi:hypothetical protein
MNQSILFNDDLHFDKSKQSWIFTGIIAGNKITVYIDERYHPQNLAVNDATKYDWEDAAENWLEINEPDENNQIFLAL